MKKTTALILAAAFVLVMLAPSLVLAQDGSVVSEDQSFATKGLSEECVENGLCTPCEMILAGVRIARFFLGISGAVSLLFLVIAGIYLIASRGNTAIIDKAKAMIKAVIIGLFFVLFSWQIINLLLVSLVDQENATEDSIPTITISGQNAVWTTITCKKISPTK